ncbi:unnamed protein product [Pipistrellus nathusii]|uniref:Uncharacterized protein n=1 Tax=Pipistrellus nathusii TaxID=59473 RepID=A0ABN9Z6T9_PIPNA
MLQLLHISQIVNHNFTSVSFWSNILRSRKVLQVTFLKKINVLFSNEIFISCSDPINIVSLVLVLVILDEYFSNICGHFYWEGARLSHLQLHTKGVFSQLLFLI